MVLINNTRATIRLAPELSPNTSGPARGFLNKVCINNPPRASADPAIIQVAAFGNLSCHMILVYSSEVWEGLKMAKSISEGEMDTLPSEMLAANKIKRVTPMNRVLKYALLASMAKVKIEFASYCMLQV